MYTQVIELVLKKCISYTYASYPYNHPPHFHPPKNNGYIKNLYAYKISKKKR